MARNISSLIFAMYRPTATRSLRGKFQKSSTTKLTKMSRFLPYIHNLRGLAILFVVGVHAGGYVTDWQSHPEVNRFLHAIFDPSEGNGTVLFLFIGGFLFQHLTHNQFDFKKYL